MFQLRHLVVWAAAAIVFGCTETRRYDLSIRNDLPTTVTACLTKTNGPAERDWLSPEQLAAPPNPAAEERTPGIPIPPGKTAVRNDVKGDFDPKTGRAFLRIYEGTPGLSQMIAISPGSVRRADVLLRPGVNRFTVNFDKSGALVILPAGPTTLPAAGQP